MHPIEHLRHVARARGADPTLLVRESAMALAAMRMDPAGVVVGCRRLIERHPECGPLWWFAASLVTAPDPGRAARALADRLDDDRTAARLRDELPDSARVVVVGGGETMVEALARRGDVEVLVVDSRHSGTSVLRRLERAEVCCDPVQPEAIGAAVRAADLVVVEASAISPDEVIAPIGSLAAAAVATALSVPVWVVAALGRRLPREYVEVIVERLDAEAPGWEADHDRVPVSMVTAVVGDDGRRSGEAAFAPECPFAPELLRTSPI